MKTVYYYVILIICVILLTFCTSKSIKQNNVVENRTEEDLELSKTQPGESKKIEKDTYKTFVDPLKDKPYYDLSFGFKAGYFVTFHKLFFFSDMDEEHVNNDISPGPLFYTTIQLNPNIINNLLVTAELGYGVFDINTSDGGNLGLYLFGGNIEYDIPFSDSLSFYLISGGGLFLSHLTSDKPYKDEMFYLPYLQGGCGINFIFDYSYSIGVEGKYMFFGVSGEPINGINIGLTTSYRFGASPEYKLNKHIDFKINMNPVFPAHANYYSSKHLGHVEIKNHLKYKINSVQAILMVENYMNSPTQGQVINNIMPGSRVNVPVKAVFNQNINNTYSDKEISALLTMKYSVEEIDDKFEYEKVIHLHLMRYNALTWDDTLKLGCFITPTDPVINNYARKTVNSYNNLKENDSNYIPVENIKNAIAIWNSLSDYGVQYIKDPKGFAKLQDFKTSVDTIQYPKEMLKSKTGDCDDFVVLYCSLLENMGVETALVTVPEHIFMMFNTGLTSTTLRTVFVNDNYLYVDDKNRVWMPLETTMISQKATFYDAWIEGSKVFKKFYNDREFITVSQCHDEYKPISLIFDERKDRILYNPDRSLNHYKKNISVFRDRILSQVDDILKRKSGKSKLNSINTALGISARYHDRKLTKKLFKKSRRLDRKQTFPFIVAGNLAYELSDYSRAKKMFRRAHKLDRKSVAAIIGLAKSYFYLGNYTKYESMVNLLDKDIREAFFSEFGVKKDKEDTDRKSDYYNQNKIFWDTN